MAIYEPYKPTLIGNAFAPMKNSPLTLDTATEVGYTFTAEGLGSNTTVATARVVSDAPFPGQTGNAEIIARLYESSDPQDLVTRNKKITLRCTSGQLGTGAALSPGASSVQQAVSNSSDSYCVGIAGANGWARYWFDTQSDVAAYNLYYDTEIVDVSVVYLAAGPFTDAPENIMQLYLESPTLGVSYLMDTRLTGPRWPWESTRMYRSRLGELNPFFYKGHDPTSSPIRGPWVWRSQDDSGLYLMDSSGANKINIKITTGPDAAGWGFDIHYLALEITYREIGSLIGVGGLNVNNGSSIVDGQFVYDIPIMAPMDYWTATDKPSPSLSEGTRATLSISRSYTGDEAVIREVPLTVSGVDMLAPLPTLAGIKMTKPVAEGALKERIPTQIVPAIAMFTSWATKSRATIVQGSQVYLQQQIAMSQLDLWAGSYSDTMQRMPDDTAGSFEWAIFYARPVGAVNGRLRVSQIDDGGYELGPEGSISVEEFYALPEVIDGWRRVMIKMSPPAILSASGLLTYWHIWSETRHNRAWEILGATSNREQTHPADVKINSAANFGSDSCWMTTDTSHDYYSSDVALMICKVLDAVSGLAVSRKTQTLTIANDCGIDPGAVPTGIYYNQITWTKLTSEMISWWGYYELQRRDTTMPADTWETIAKITTPFASTFDDYEARIGVVSTYRIRAVHVTGPYGPWSSSVSIAMASPGVTGTNVDHGALVFTSNADPTKNLAYTHTTAKPANQDFTFPEAGTAATLALYGRDYPVATRPAERGGVAFERTLLTNAVGVPSETMSDGFNTVRDLAWAPIPYVCVRDDLGNRWLATLTVPSGSVRQLDAGTHLMLARVTVAEVADEPTALDAPEPYLGIEATRNHQTRASALGKDSMNTVRDLDIRMKVIRRDTDGQIIFNITAPASWYPSYQQSIVFSTFIDNLMFYAYDTSHNSFLDQSVSPVPAVMRPTWVRAVTDADVGGGNAKVTYYYSYDGSAWTTIGTVSGTDAYTPVIDSTSFVTVYSIDGWVCQHVTVYAAGTSTKLFDADFEANGQSTTFVDAAGITWTMEDM